MQTLLLFMPLFLSVNAFGLEERRITNAEKLPQFWEKVEFEEVTINHIAVGYKNLFLNGNLGRHAIAPSKRIINELCTSGPFDRYYIPQSKNSFFNVVINKVNDQEGSSSSVYMRQLALYTGEQLVESPQQSNGNKPLSMFIGSYDLYCLDHRVNFSELDFPGFIKSVSLIKKYDAPVGPNGASNKRVVFTIDQPKLYDHFFGVLKDENLMSVSHDGGHYVTNRKKLALNACTMLGRMAQQGIKPGQRNDYYLGLVDAEGEFETSMESDSAIFPLKSVYKTNRRFDRDNDPSLYKTSILKSGTAGEEFLLLYNRMSHTPQMYVESKSSERLSKGTCTFEEHVKGSSGFWGTN